MTGQSMFHTFGHIQKAIINKKIKPHWAEEMEKAIRQRVIFKADDLNAPSVSRPKKYRE